MVIVSGKLTLSDYSPDGDRLWLEINGELMKVSRGWSPSQYNPLEGLGNLSKETRLAISFQLEVIAKLVFDSYAERDKSATPERNENVV